MALIVFIQGFSGLRSSTDSLNRKQSLIRSIKGTQPIVACHQSSIRPINPTWTPMLPIRMQLSSTIKITHWRSYWRLSYKNWTTMSSSSSSSKRDSTCSRIKWPATWSSSVPIWPWSRTRPPKPASCCRKSMTKSKAWEPERTGGAQSSCSVMPSKIERCAGCGICFWSWGV